MNVIFVVPRLTNHQAATAVLARPPLALPLAAQGHIQQEELDPVQAVQWANTKALQAKADASDAQLGCIKALQGSRVVLHASRVCTVQEVPVLALQFHQVRMISVVKLIAYPHFSPVNTRRLLRWIWLDLILSQQLCNGLLLHW